MWQRSTTHGSEVMLLLWRQPLSITSVDKSLQTRIDRVCAHQELNCVCVCVRGRTHACVSGGQHAGAAESQVPSHTCNLLRLFSVLCLGLVCSSRQWSAAGWVRSCDSTGGQYSQSEQLFQCLHHNTQRVKQQLFIGSYAEKNIHIVIIQAEAKCL